MGIFSSIFSSTWMCPVCGKEVSNNNKGAVSFNNCYLCSDCSVKVESFYKNKHIEHAYLEEMRAIVTGKYEDTENNYFTYENILIDLENKYKTIEDKHFELLDKIYEQYSIAINQDELNEEVRKCMNLCMQDIKLADELIIFYKKCEKILRQKRIPAYPSFSRISRLYEVFYHDYLNAMFFCYKGLVLGYSDDSKNGFKGKIAKYLKKYNKENNKNYKFNYENAVLFDDDTGEIIELIKKQ